MHDLKIKFDNPLSGLCNSRIIRQEGECKSQDTQTNIKIFLNSAYFLTIVYWNNSHFRSHSSQLTKAISG